jgi:hypothetical protein
VEFRLEIIRKIMENSCQNRWCPAKIWSWPFQKAKLKSEFLSWYQFPLTDKKCTVHKILVEIPRRQSPLRISRFKGGGGDNIKIYLR